MRPVKGDSIRWRGQRQVERLEEVACKRSKVSYRGRERSGMDTEIVGGIRSRQYRLGNHDMPHREVSSKRMM